MSASSRSRRPLLLPAGRLHAGKPKERNPVLPPRRCSCGFTGRRGFNLHLRRFPRHQEIR